jgi:hypothetical protein
MGLSEAYVPLCVSLLDPLVDAMNQRVEIIHQQAVELVGGLQVIIASCNLDCKFWVNEKKLSKALLCGAFNSFALLWLGIIQNFAGRAGGRAGGRARGGLEA